MKSKKIISAILSAVMLLSVLPISASAENADEFHFSSDGKFKILQISDPQDDAYPAYELDEFIKTALESSDPDLVIITGDIVEDSRFGDVFSDGKKFQEGVNVYDKNGELDYNATLDNVKKACEAVFTPIEEAGIPFAVTQGNNDYKSKISNEDWLKIFDLYPHCITVDMSNDSQGKIDQYVEINANGTDNAAYGLWLLDNGESFTQEQAEWFSSYNTGDVPSLVFEHVPVSDVGNLFEECSVFDAGALIKGNGAYRLNKNIANGTYYVVYKPGETSDQFTSWKSKNVKGAFFGHIHTDGYTGQWDGITLGLTYGCEFAKAGPYGFRTLTLDEDGTFETELFTYSKGTASEQTYDNYPEYNNGIQKFFSSVINLFASLFNTIDALLKF